MNLKMNIIKTSTSNKFDAFVNKVKENIVTKKTRKMKLIKEQIVDVEEDVIFDKYEYLKMKYQSAYYTKKLFKEELIFDKANNLNSQDQKKRTINKSGEDGIFSI